MPDPNVSGRYFSPNAPLLWVKRMPATSVMSVKTTDVAAERVMKAEQAVARGNNCFMAIRDDLYCSAARISLGVGPSRYNQMASSVR